MDFMADPTWPAVYTAAVVAGCGVIHLILYAAYIRRELLNACCNATGSADQNRVELPPPANQTTYADGYPRAEE